MMMIMRMKRFMFDECVGGCRGRLLIFDHTHIAHAYCTVCSVVVIFSVLSPLSLLCLRDDPSPFKICNSHSRCTSPVSSVICCGFPLEVHLTLLQVGFQLVFVAFPLAASFRFPDESSAYSSCFGTRVSGMRLTCPAQLSCDLTMCASMLVVSA